MDWLHLPDVAINLANLYLAQRQIPAAIQLYTTTLQKHYKNNSTIMLYLARALYDAGKNSQAKRVLLKAIHLQPTQNLLRFNSAVTMQVDLWGHEHVLWCCVVFLPTSASFQMCLVSAYHEHVVVLLRSTQGSVVSLAGLCKSCTGLAGGLHAVSCLDKLGCQVLCSCLGLCRPFCAPW